MEPLAAIQHFTKKPLLSVSPYGQGRIHQTYLAECSEGEKYILQKLHSIFKAPVLEDIEAVTTHLREKGLTTPRIVRTLDGELGYCKGGECWRMLTYIPGKTFEASITPLQAESAGALVGVFHNALLDLEYSYKHALPGFHDTKHIMERLKQVVDANVGGEKYQVLAPLAEEILSAYRPVRGALASLPLRHVHGDLKLNNILFDKDGVSALALLDLDTLGKMSIPIEMGDAARSWCNQRDEDATDPQFDMAIFESMMRGYFSKATFLSRVERAAIPTGIATIILELSARFVTDAFEESYFTLDTSRYQSRYVQNMAKANGQMKLYRDFITKKEVAERIVGL